MIMIRWTDLIVIFIAVSVFALCIQLLHEQIMLHPSAKVKICSLFFVEWLAAYMQYLHLVSIHIDSNFPHNSFYGIFSHRLWYCVSRFLLRRTRMYDFELIGAEDS